MTPYAPAVLGTSGINVGGFLIGWFVLRTLKTATILAGIVPVLVRLLAPLGWAGGAIQGWVNTSVAWMTDSAQSAMHFLVVSLPSANAVAIGRTLGFRR